MSPSSGPIGQTVTVTGTGWIEDHQFGSSVSIWIGNPLEREVAVANPDANGNFSASFVIPASTPEGELLISALGSQSAEAIYTVTKGVILPNTVRDFCGIRFDASACPAGYVPHPDFENVISDDRGLVNTTLGGDGTPVPIAIFPTATVQSADSFNQWYHDSAGINQTATVALALSETSPGSGVYVYDNSNFFPIDNQLLGNQGQIHNYSFTLALHAAFRYVPGQVFEVTADDDVWVFINNQLVIDLGGVHLAESASVNLDTLGLTAGQKYSFDLFFAERHTAESKLTLQTSIVFEPFLLPFSVGQKWTICQGYNGFISHTGTLKYALDLSIDPNSAGPQG